jgi:U3 small nucleolar RNA-associated protein 5
MSHFVSRADNERIINAWSVSSSTPVERNAVTSFSAPEELKQIHVDRHAQQPDSVCLVALSRENSVHIFSHPLNGYHGKPISPKCTVQIAPSSKDQADTLISPLPVLSACLCSLRDESLIIAYGSIIRPVFERLSPVQEERHVCLVRQMDGGWLEGARKRSEHQKPKVKRASSAGHVLGPGQTPLTGHMQQETDLDKQEELTIEERLSLLSVTKANPPTKRSGPPTAESQSQMLVQALHSQDKQLLESVLRTNKERVVEHTVRRLPSTLVVPLIKEVVHRIQSRPTRAAELIVWIRSTLLIHSSYLMTVPGLADSLGTLYSVLDVRRTVYPKLLGLQGRLDVMLSQVSEQANRDEVAANGDPLAVYIEEDSDDDYPTPPALSDHWSDEDSEGQIEDHHEQTRMTDDDDNDRLDGSSDSDIDSKSMVEDG